MNATAARAPLAAATPEPGRFGPYALLAGSILGGLVAAQLITGGRGVAVFALSLVLVPVFLWRKPEYAPAMLLGGALAVEQFGYTVGPQAGAATSRIPLFHGLGSFHVNPLDLFLVVLVGVYVAKRGTVAVRRMPTTPLARAVYCVVGAVLLGVIVGKAHGGDLRFAFTETRPYVYLAVTYVLASVLVTTREAVRALMWVLVLVVAFKALQGLLVFLSVRHYATRPDAVLSHEESLFFALYLLLAIALWLFEVPGRLRTTTTALVPLVLAGDLANTRRAAWLVLGVGLVALFAVASATLPHRRRVIARASVALAVGLALYLPAYWNKSGGLAQPARAIHSAIKPTPRDQSSDLYRVQEDANLKLNIRQAGPLGKGFGVPIDYTLPIEDISDIDPLIKYIPHNGVLYIPMRMGVLGGIAFWSMLGLAVVSACRLARSPRPELAVIGGVMPAILVAYAFEGATDQGFFFYRVAIVMGTLLGVTEAARRLSQNSGSTE